MTTHYIIPCSARKALEPNPELIWDKKTKITQWKIAWEQASHKLPVSEMYTGYSMTRSLEAISKSSGDWRIWIVSAGRGLIPGPSSIGIEEEKIPAYDVHCFPTLPMSPGRMRNLWEGGVEESYDNSGQNQWSKLDVADGDCLISSLPKSYQSAVLPSLSEYVPKTVDMIGIGSHYHGGDSMQALGKHPRIREVLGCGFSMLRATLLGKWISGGKDAIEELDYRAGRLSKKTTRRRVSDEDLLIALESFESISSIANSVKYIRHTLGISASNERIRDAIDQLR